jgi:hypothetical protein
MFQSDLCHILAAHQLLQGTHIFNKNATCEVVDVAVQNMVQVKLIQIWDNQCETLIECSTHRGTHAPYYGVVWGGLTMSREWF